MHTHSLEMMPIKFTFYPKAPMSIHSLIQEYKTV